MRTGPLRVLFTNLTLASRTGTELYVKEAAIGLLRRGHAPMVYSPELGPIAAEIRAATVPVVDDLTRLGEPPDLIHAHHQPTAMAALARFPGVPAVFVAHDWMSWQDAPPRFPTILRYVAVDRTNRDRLVLEHGIPEERVRVLHNWVDLERFRPRDPLPERPRRALVFSNYASEGTHLPAVEEACRRAGTGIPLDTVGSGVGRSLKHPEEALREYDLVFAKARCALEALAVGAAVVLCDFRGLGPMVTAGEVERLRDLNFGLRTLRDPLDPDALLREIGRYDPRDAAEASRLVRETSGLEAALDRLLDLYGEVLEESRRLGPPAPAAEREALAAHLQTWSSWARTLRDRCWELETEKHQLWTRVHSLEREHAARVEELGAELRWMQSSPVWRLRSSLLRLPGIAAAWRALRRTG